MPYINAKMFYILLSKLIPKDQMFLMGSRRFGYSIWNSDYDICILDTPENQFTLVKCGVISFENESGYTPTGLHSRVEGFGDIILEKSEEKFNKRKIQHEKLKEALEKKGNSLSELLCYMKLGGIIENKDKKGVGTGKYIYRILCSLLLNEEAV